MTDRYKPNEPTCPVPIELLALLLRSPGERVAEITLELSALQRAALAVYCVGRTHTRRIGLLVAAECSEHALSEVAGRAGLAIHEQCRDEGSFDREPGIPARRKVSLARGICPGNPEGRQPKTGRDRRPTPPQCTPPCIQRRPSRRASAADRPAMQRADRLDSLHRPDLSIR